MPEKERWTLEEARALARQLEQAERPVDLDKRALVQSELIPVINRKLRQGWTHESVCEELARLGVEVAPSTLRRYLREAKAARRKRKDTWAGQRPRGSGAGDGAPAESDASAESAGDDAGGASNNPATVDDYSSVSSNNPSPVDHDERQVPAFGAGKDRAAQIVRPPKGTFGD